MIIVMKADVLPESPEVQQVVRMAERYPNVKAEVRKIEGATRVLTEIYLLGPTERCRRRPSRSSPASRRWSASPSATARSAATTTAEALGFEYNGVHFTQDTFHLFAGLCAVDTRENVEAMFAACTQPRHRDDARGRVQAAHQPLRLPGPRRASACPGSSSSPASTASRSSPWR